jgi:hypothetical protein
MISYADVEKLLAVHSEGLVPGFACRQCGALGATGTGCAHQGTAAFAVPDLIEDLADRHRYREPGNRAVGLGLHLKRLRIHHAHTRTFRCVPQRTAKPGTQAALRVQPGALVGDSLDVGGGGKAGRKAASAAGSWPVSGR